MDPVVTVILLFGVALFCGGLGWFLGSRPVAEWKARAAEAATNLREAQDSLTRMAPELATMSDRAARADTLAQLLDEV
ncbi:MAG: DNA recombination protein RmuC, partial [Sphingomonadaceae bacterium]